MSMTSGVLSVWRCPWLVNFCFFWLPPLLLTAGIFILAGDLGSTSKFRLPVIILQFLLPSLSMSEIVWISDILRKVAHFLVYGLLLIGYARAWHWHIRMKPLPAIVLALMICLAVSAADEARQALHRSRSGCPQDVALDMSGALAAAGVMYPLLRRGRRDQPKSEL
ncbi:MAG TPA: hypothetical protein DCY27_00490 [Desulfobacterales bacterium]|nr:hypothetical protein [Desulfobacterales bacterium]